MNKKVHLSCFLVSLVTFEIFDQQLKVSWEHLEEGGPPVGEGGHGEATDGENYRAAEIMMII